MKTRTTMLALVAGAFALVAPSVAFTQEARRSAAAATADALARTYADIAFETYSDAAKAAGVLKEAAETLKKEPNALSLASLRLAWVEARTPFMQAEVFRFAGGPIDAGLLALDGRVNPGFIDGEAASLVVDSATYPVLDAAVLAKLNAGADPANVATGFHALEFLLWGAPADGGAGQRPFTDFLATDPEGARRVDYLLACAGRLEQQLAGLAAEWNPATPESYRATTFLKLPADTVLGRILASVSALAGQVLAESRIGGPLAAKDGKLAESPFGNLTNLDILHASAGIANVMAGAYLGTDSKAGMRVTGTGLIAVVEARDAEQGKALREAVNAAILAARALEGSFSAAVEAGEDDPAQRALAACAASLKKLADAAKSAAAALGVKSDLSGD